MQCLQNSEIFILTNIFKNVNNPLNFALTCRNWSVIAKDPYAKVKWLIVHYGKAHALFHAVRLGPSFIDMKVYLYQALIEKEVITSRYLIHFGKYNKKLIENRQFNDGKIHTFQQKIKSLWARNLFIFVFAYLLKDLPSKGNNMELVRFIIHVHGMLIKNFKDLIKNFITLSPRSKSDLNSAFHICQPLIPKKYLSNNKFDLIKFFDALQEESFSRPLTVLPLLINNVGMRPSRNVNQRRQRRRNQLQRNMNRIYRNQVQYEPINNDDTLKRIANLPLQVTNDPLIDQFFNGTPFI
ncbi:hypothetical protein C1645_843009 [Glomus cerebriforme]|uniref:Uncharacterized protein n=1 Tax=Glomus cerebriforme TaxID=658196 RepID=A0A397TQM8_9GLOM|nr:hypothetical protein C1645_843009 [Glomus cerebriforme]